jgi:hypothetical protein
MMSRTIFMDEQENEEDIHGVQSLRQNVKYIFPFLRRHEWCEAGVQNIMMHASICMTHPGIQSSGNPI